MSSSNGADNDNDAETREENEAVPLSDLRQLVGGTCGGCHKPYSARDVVFSLALGFKNTPRCLPCLAAILEQEETDLRSQLRSYIECRECYLKAWREAERMDGVVATAAPHPQHGAAVATFESPTIAASWDAGGMGCGELVMALRMRMAHLSPGDVIEVIATDPAAPEDLPAWCRMCGHTLVAMTHPKYFIRRKGT